VTSNDIDCNKTLNGIGKTYLLTCSSGIGDMQHRLFLDKFDKVATVEITFRGHSR